MPDLHTGKRGDEVVKVIVDIPKKLSRKQEALLREVFGKERIGITKGFFDKMKDFV